MTQRGILFTLEKQKRSQLPHNFDTARRILEQAEKLLSETGKPLDKLPQTLEEKLASAIASAFEDDNEEGNVNAR